MRACFGILHHNANADFTDVRNLTGGNVLPVLSGSLFLFNPERYTLCFSTLCEFVRANPNFRYIFTIGDFNDGERPQFYDLYSRFAASTVAAQGEVLLCAQTFANAGGGCRLFPNIEYLPLVTGIFTGSPFMHTGLGRLESSDVWYSTRNVTYVDPHAHFEGMTHRAELPFWYSPAGFLYLAHQAAIIRAYKTHTRRVVIYLNSDLASSQFIKLIFTFDAIGVEIAFVAEDQLNVFTEGHGLNRIEIFSRAGNNSLVTIGGEAYYSDDADVARMISDAQKDLIARPGVFPSIAEFMRANEAAIGGTRQSWRRRAGTAKQLLEKFASYPLAQQHVVLETYVERWRTL